MSDLNIKEQNIVDTLELNYMPYAMTVIISRAIPEMDGFKPSHRKLLYTMYKMGLINGGRIKSADVVGRTMALNPHGDGAIYETLVRLTAGNAALLHPFIDSKGNFGKQYSRDMAYAASRYTEVKLDAICNELFKDIEKNAVEFVENYNGSTKEPLLFPTTFPNLLVTPNQGIAVGMASCICSFNLKEVCETTIAYIKNKEIDLLKTLKAPDFSTGAELIYNQKELEAIYQTGRGGFKLRAKYRYDKKNSCIEIYEIPYSTTVEVIIDKIISLVKSGKVREINDIRDETDLGGLKIAIDIKKAADPDLIMYKLFASTSLSDSFNCNFNILVNGKPKVMGIKEILDEWLIFRTDCIRRQCIFDVEKKKEKLNYLLGFSKILPNIDKVIKIIRETEVEKNVIPNLMQSFDINKEQAEYIAEIKLRNLNREYLLNRINEKENLKKETEELENTIDDDERIHAIISKQLKEVSKKYSKPRATEIVYTEEVPKISEEQLINDYPIKIFLTKHNYFKKISLISLRLASEQQLKADDEIAQEIETSNKSDVLFFSDKFNVYKYRAYELEDCKASGLGEYLSNLLNLEENEKIIYMCSTTDYKGYMFFAFENGKASKINMSSYFTKVNRRKLLNAYSDKSPLVYISYFEDDIELVAMRDRDKASLFNTELVLPKTSKNSSGVQVYTLKKKSKLSTLKKKEDFKSEDIQYYKTTKIPSSGHFILEKDKLNFKFQTD